MQKPHLIIIAGCNGAGKSTYSKSFVNDIIPFDFDKRFMENYATLIDSEFRETMANNITSEQFTNEIEVAFSENKSFCYETNFNNNPLVWAQKAKDFGYKVELLFFCLESIDLAKKRVQYRTENKGHFVADSTIFERWKDGYRNLNLHFLFFDYILLIDNSSENSGPLELFELEKSKENQFVLRQFCDELPEYSKRRFPTIFNLLKN